TNSSNSRTLIVQILVANRSENRCRNTLCDKGDAHKVIESVVLTSMRASNSTNDLTLLKVVTCLPIRLKRFTLHSRSVNKLVLSTFLARSTSKSVAET